jgi:hypothetical protein
MLFVSMSFLKRVFLMIVWFVLSWTSHVPVLPEILAVLGSVSKADFGTMSTKKWHGKVICTTQQW